MAGGSDTRVARARQEGRVKLQQVQGTPGSSCSVRESAKSAEAANAGPWAASLLAGLQAPFFVASLPAPQLPFLLFPHPVICESLFFSKIRIM